MSGLVASFRAAFRGLWAAIWAGRNMKIHLLAVAVVVCAGIWRGLAPWGWAAVCICFGLVLGAELCNTAVERLCDIVRPERDERVGLVKDIAAGAVLVCAMASAAVAVVVFWAGG